MSVSSVSLSVCMCLLASVDLVQFIIVLFVTTLYLSVMFLNLDKIENEQRIIMPFLNTQVFTHKTRPYEDYYASY